MEQFFLATGNQHKIKEVLEIAPQIAWLTVNDFSALKNFEPAETGKSFSENAEIKAKAFAEKTGLITVAEDSGLEVESLNQEPGIYSARWVMGTDTDRNLALLKKLEGETNRAARYVATLCVFNPKTGQTDFFRGEVKGVIAHEIRGSHGFGYDPVFIPVGYTATFGELDETIKQRFSHRKEAFKNFLAWLKA